MKRFIIFLFLTTLFTSMTFAQDEFFEKYSDKKGVSVTFISSEVEEMLRTCSRLIVMRDRHIVGELKGADLNQTQVMKTIAGGEA